jgi:hypothetical protein
LTEGEKWLEGSVGLSEPPGHKKELISFFLRLVGISYTACKFIVFTVSSKGSGIVLENKLMATAVCDSRHFNVGWCFVESLL